ncbi:hypothetical protein CKALI_09985 [Corynebacterium kalinowskii]|uniref:Uncharacterized protein n=1 Tax=Corynebacterium kalinowskii TaxID=2675216 RepID=A0A6B8VCI4_9CORY|nr:DUF2786 domain-containing protein [Corynebacterium kalinowskii]QGU02852.1 hypothetical protein CKALI_09985 [Corynebacterium kalinowskii]
MEKIKERIRKLLAQAEDQQGTPEGDVFYDKAFALIAQYGIDRSELDHDDESVTMRTFAIDGSYSGMQASLLISLGEVLHCVGFNTGPRPSRIYSVTLFGLPKHLDRVEMLYSMLRLSMLSGARRITDEWSTVKARRSFMSGFICRISQRLVDAEETAVSAVPGQGLALIDDAHLAYLAQVAYLSQNNLHLHEIRSRGGLRPDAFDAGLRAGNGADIGQQRVSGSRAIGAPF